MISIDCGVIMNVGEEAIRKAVALAKYADGYMLENELHEEISIGGVNYIEEVVKLRRKIYLARMRDYTCYPELIERDYSL